MKKFLTLLVGVFCLLTSNAQVSQTEKDLLKKYWDYRDRYKKHFVKIGREAGESVPISEWFKTQNCGDIQGGQIKTGDAMGNLGDYMCLLATEYYLTKKQGGDLTAIRNEIYYALKALERVDLFAEIYLRGMKGSGSLNGFVLRDDTPLDFYKNWQVTDNVQFLDGNRSNGFLWDTTFISVAPINYDFAPDANFPNDTIWIPGTGRCHFKWSNNAAGYKPDNLEHWDAYKWYFPIDPITGPGTLGCGKIKNDTIFNDDQSVRNNEMSQDHLIGLLTGLVAIAKFVDDDLIVPTPQDDTTWLRSLARDLGKRLVDYISGPKRVRYPYIMLPFSSLDLPNWIDSLPKWVVDIPINDLPFTLTDELDINWFLDNPITHKQVKAGMNAWLFSYPLSEIGNRFLPANNYNPQLVCKTTGSIQYNILGFSLLNLIGATLNQTQSQVNAVVDLLNDPESLWELLYTRQRNNDPSNDVTNQMICWLGAASGTFSGSGYSNLVDTFGMPWFELLDCVLNRYSAQQDEFLGPYNKDRNFYRNLLDSAACEGNKKESSEGIHFPFNRPSLFSLPNAEYASRVVGDYNGMDYMLLYNMYRMVFPDSLPDYIPNTCPCNNSTTKVLETIGTGIGDGGHSLRTNVETFFRFPDYKKYHIPIPEFANHDIDIGDSIPSASVHELKINGDLTICNSTMQVLNKGKLHITPSVPDYEREIRVTNGSELRIANYGIVEIGNLSSLIIEKGGKLTVGPNSHIILNGSASKLIVEGQLELEGGAEFKIEWPEDSIPGTVIFKSNANKLDSRLKITATGPNAVLNLSSLDDDHTYLKIVGGAGIEVDSSIKKTIVQNAGIIMDEDSRIRVNSELTVDYVNVNASIPGVNHTYNSAFDVYGQKKVHISHCTFKSGYRAIAGQLYQYGDNRPELSFLTIDTCYYGIQFKSGGINLSNSTIQNCRVGIDLQATTRPSDIVSCLFDGNIKKSILINTTSSGPLYVMKCTFDGGKQCITSGGATIKSRCNLMKNTDQAIYLNDMALIDLNGANGAGYNRIEDNDYGIYGDQYQYSNPQYMNTSGHVDLNNGYTAFRNTDMQIKLLLCNRQNLEPPIPPIVVASSLNFWQLHGTVLDDSVDYLLDYKPGFITARYNGTIFPSVDYSLFSTLNTVMADKCDWTPGTSFILPPDTMIKDCDDKIFTSSLVGSATLYQAYTASNLSMYEDYNNAQAYLGYKEMLLAPFFASSRCQADIYYLTKAYQNIFLAFGNLSNDTLTTDSTSTVYCNDMIDLVDSLLVLADDGDSLWEAHRYMLNLDKSDLLRISGDRESAIDLLNEMAGDYETSPVQLEKINYHLCVNQHELAVLTSGTPEAEIDSNYNCYRDFTPEGEEEGSEPNRQNNPAKIKEVNKPIISLMPNPANDAITLSSNQPIKGVIVYDNIGKEVIRVSNQNTQTLKIDISKLPNGIYRVLIDMGRAKSLKTFMVN